MIVGISCDTPAENSAFRDKYEFPSISEGDFEFSGYYQWREDKDDAKQKSVVKAGREQGAARCHKKFD